MPLLRPWSRRLESRSPFPSFLHSQIGLAQAEVGDSPIRQRRRAALVVVLSLPICSDACTSHAGCLQALGPDPLRVAGQAS